MGWLFIRHETVNEMDPVLDKLASITLADRWSKPEMLRIRHWCRGCSIVAPRIKGEGHADNTPAPLDEDELAIRHRYYHICPIPTN